MLLSAETLWLCFVDEAIFCKSLDRLPQPPTHKNSLVVHKLNRVNAIFQLENGKDHQKVRLYKLYKAFSWKIHSKYIGIK